MLIGIDGNEANTENRVGIGQFAYNVICQLEKIDRDNGYLVYLKDKPLGDLPPERAGWKYIIFGPQKAWTQFALPFKLYTQKHKHDVFYSPSHYAPRFCPVPSVISIMDLWHHRHPEQFTKKDIYQLINWEKYSVNNARAIITISEFSKKEMQYFYPEFRGEIKIAYPGYTKHQAPSTKSQTNTKYKIQKLKQKYGINGDYLLYLGTLQPKKNVENLIRAYSLLVQDTRYPLRPRSEASVIHDTTLVIAGKKGWLYDKIFSLVQELKLEERVIFTGFVEEEEKPVLIQNALAFVLPSFYEGFGIPVAEAMDLGVPVVISNAASLPEVGGSSAIYCDPDKPESIALALEKVINLNKTERNEIIQAGRKWVKQFSWEKCARGVLETLEIVGNT